MLFVALGLFTFTTVFAADQLQTIEVFDYKNESALEHFGHSAKKLHTRELKQRREVSLGDTLKSEAGVTSNSFGPNAGRPVIRGLEGDRVKILQNGLGVLDASAQSADHAVPVDTLVIDSIDVVRGPLALLYGSSALGGVVNVTTNRIHSHFEEGTLREVQVQGDSSNNGLSTGAKLDHGKNNWMVHVDASYRNTNDQRIPGHQASSRLRKDDATATQHKDTLKNSMSVQKSTGLGVSRIFKKGHVGVSYYRFDNYYGTVAEEEVKIKMLQDRVELHTEYRPESDVLQAVRLKSAQSDYGHRELEGSEVGTTFANEGNESRLEFVTKTGDVHGVSGFQTQLFNFSAVGDEAFLPKTRNATLSAFTLQEVAKAADSYVIGLRVDNSHVHNQDLDKQQNVNGASASAGWNHKFIDQFSTSINVSYIERAPNFQELYADGPHLATGVFEQGDDELNKEKGHSIDVGLKFKQDRDSINLNIYTQKFKDYIVLANSGATDGGSGLPILNYEQTDAIFYGLDLEGRKGLASLPNYTLVLKSDFVRGKDEDSGKNLPRVPQARTSVGIERMQDKWTWDAEVQYNFAQTKTAPDELVTSDFTLVNVGMTYDIPVGETSQLSTFLRFKNILNEEVRLHTSTLKDIAPQPGRNVVGGLQYLF